MASIFENFVACPACGCHAKSHEVECPHCGSRLRRADGSMPKTAAAMLLGLSAIAIPAGILMAGCSDDTGGGSGGGGSVSSSSSSSSGSESSSSSSGSSGVGGATPVYGVPMTDADQDGHFPEAAGTASYDCNDNDPKIYTGAPETPGDGVDSNCDGSDNT